MIERNGDDFELICDHCGKTPMIGFDTFDEAVGYKARKRWTSVKTKTRGWVDLCPLCATPEIIREYREK
jgi:hypothetical protein